MPDEPRRIEGLDALRGAASFAVCWYHLVGFRYQTADGRLFEVLRASAAYGWLGVEVFFVISGFIIPYSLHRAGYRLRDYPSFILKRLVRLDPPYLVTIALILALGYAYAAYAARPAEVEGVAVTWTRVLLHLGYANAFFGHRALNPVFWTLAIEFQYYLLVGLISPMLSNRSRGVRLGVFALFAGPILLRAAGLLPGYIPDTVRLFRYAFLFLLGVAAFQRRAGLTGRAEYVTAVAACAVGAALTLGVLPALAGLLSVAGINYYSLKSGVTDFFGRISYSLYLLHWPVGHYVLSLVGMKLLRADTDAEKALTLAAALGATVAASYLLYVAVERPAQHWSSRIRYGRRRARAEETSGFAPAAEPN
jgi:peptidoglycan/LPS O-acetylase OafA/YrhL